MSKSTLYLVDDHQLVIDGIISLVEGSGEWEVIGYANSGEEALKKIPILKPDIILMDLEMQDAIFRNAPGFALPAYKNLWRQSKYIPTNRVAMEQEPVATDPNGNIIPGTYPGPAHNPAMAAAGTAGIMADMVADILRGTPVKDAVKTCHERYVKVFKEFKLPGEKK